MTTTKMAIANVGIGGKEGVGKGGKVGVGAGVMSEAEREAILSGLKQNWDELHPQYQSLSVVTDTIPKRMKKERIENEMKAIEKDIDLLSRHQLIYIAD